MQQIQQPVMQVMILKNLRSLIKEDFLKLRTLVFLQQVKTIQIPCSTFSQSLNVDQVFVLNVFIYYTLFVKYKIDIFGNDLQGDNFRSFCVKQISHYYLQNKFQIQLREFSFLVGAILQIKTYDCAHILFHLIYGRFASQPFIRLLCANFHKANKINIKSCQRHIKTQQTSRRITPNNKNQLEINEFYQELKNSLDPQPRNTKPKRPAIGKRQNQKIKFKIPNQFHQSQQNIFPQNFQQKERAHQIPVGIRKGQNSSIMESLPFHKTQLNFRDQSKKSSMRKQKFNLKLSFDNLKTLQKNSKPFDKKNQNKDETQKFPSLKSSSIAKTGINKVKLIAFQLKSQNQYFDEARKLCEFKNIKSERCRQTKNYEALNKQQTQQVTLPHSMNQFEKIEFKKLIVKLINSCNQGHFQVKNQQKLMQTNNLRINRLQQTNRTQNQFQKLHNIFTEQSFGWTNSNCKKRVQTFKNQYRKFLNTQIFEKIIRANDLQI